MAGFEKLVRQAQSGRHQRVAADELVRAGASALPEVIAAVASSDTEEPQLTKIVKRNLSPAAIPVLMAHVDTGPASLTDAVFSALVASSDEGARSFTLEHVKDQAALESTRTAAARALVGHIASQEKAALRTVLAEGWRDGDNSRLLTEAAIALATTGDHSGHEALEPLMTCPDETVRSLAIGSLSIVVGPPVFSWLARAAKDRSPEVRRAVIDPLFLLGAPASVTLLLQLSKDGDPGVRTHSRVRAADILSLVIPGDDNDEEFAFIQHEWSERHASFRPGVCHRYAVPIDLNDLLEDFREDPSVRSDMVYELQILTGIDVPALVEESGEDAVIPELHGTPFTVGAVNKWGHAVPMPEPPDPL